MAMFVPPAAALLAAVRLAGGSVWIAFALICILFATIAATRVAPRWRQLRRATDAADALAHSRFEEARVPGSGDEFGPLASALNTAASNVERLVGQLRNERAQLEALLNASSDATVAIEASGAVAYLNAAARQLFGVDADVVGRPFIEVVRDHDLNDVLIAAARDGDRNVRVVAYGAAQRWLQASAVPIAGGGGWAALAVFHDLTEVRRLDSMRRDFISNVSHELRTPLAGIRAAAETLQEGALDDHAAAQEFLGHIQRETDRMTQLVEELLELSRIESGVAPFALEPIDASMLVQDTARRFAQQAERAGLVLGCDLPPGPMPLIGDGERLERALGNLVANAIKFTPAGGTIELRAAADDAEVRLSVADTGIGIEPDQQARVFERFYKADRGRGSGTGLGLAIVKHIVRAHSGDVSLESRPGRGSTFTMRLPRRPAGDGARPQ